MHSVMKWLMDAYCLPKHLENGAKLMSDHRMSTRTRMCPARDYLLGMNVYIHDTFAAVVGVFQMLEFRGRL